jgi:3-dehydroquinate synthase
VLAADATLLQRINERFAIDPHLELAAAPIAISGGECAKKDWAVVEQLGEVARQTGLCRHSAIIALGGGAVLDAVGLAAALIHRGVRLVRLPTTTLGQADAGLGVKNAINAFQAKNFFGTFVPPHAVINDSHFVPTLPDRQWRCGLAEAIKVALIKDAAFFRQLVNATDKLAQRDEACMAWAIRESARLHLEHICGNGDPFERGTSRPLDFGHWSAHWLEMQVQPAGSLLHGEAVAIGCAVDAWYAVEQGWLETSSAQDLCNFLKGIGFKLHHERLTNGWNTEGSWSLLSGLEEFRQHLGGQLTIAMPNSLGSVQDCFEIDAEVLKRAIGKSRQSAET